MSNHAKYVKKFIEKVVKASRGNIHPQRQYELELELINKLKELTNVQVSA